MSSAPTPPREREELEIIVATNGPSVVKIADRILAAGYRKGGGEPTEAMVDAAIAVDMEDFSWPALGPPPAQAMKAARAFYRKVVRAALRAQEGTNG